MTQKWQNRGSVSNPANRFQRFEKALEADALAEQSRNPQTVAEERQCRRIISRNQSPDIPFAQSLNPYQGCEHGCIYCYARPTHAYLDLSPGLDFETRIQVKTNALERLREELRKPTYQCQPLALGANTDPYQALERDYRLTRGMLELLDECNHPVTIVTKSALLQRDLDVIARMAERNLAQVMVSVTSLDKSLMQSLEPRAAVPQRRLKLVQQLREAGVPVGVLLAPIIPFINDAELEDIVAAAAAAGAERMHYVMLRLPLELKEMFSDWLENHFPDRRNRVLNRLRDLHEGELYRAGFGQRQHGSGDYAEMIAQRFRLALKKQAILAQRSVTLDCGQFRPPAADSSQLPLF